MESRFGIQVWNPGLESRFGTHTPQPRPFAACGGCRYVLLQHLTKLFVVHIGIVSEAFLYQQALRRWGNLSTIRLSTPASVYELCLTALDDPLSGYSSAHGEPEDIARGVQELLSDKAEMLSEYLSLDIVDGCLCTLPQIVDGYIPPLCGLPLFVLRLATKVDWTAEQPCFETLARQLALLYRVSKLGDFDTGQECSAARAEIAAAAVRAGKVTTGDDVSWEEACSEAWTIQHVLLPAIRKDFEAPSAHASNGTVVQVACTEMLYKIFERC